MTAQLIDGNALSRQLRAKWPNVPLPSKPGA